MDPGKEVPDLNSVGIDEWFPEASGEAGLFVGGTASSSYAAMLGGAMGGETSAVAGGLAQKLFAGGVDDDVFGATDDVAASRGPPQCVARWPSCTARRMTLWAASGMPWQARKVRGLGTTKGHGAVGTLGRGAASALFDQALRRMTSRWQPSDTEQREARGVTGGRGAACRAPWGAAWLASSIAGSTRRVPLGQHDGRPGARRRGRLWVRHHVGAWSAWRTPWWRGLLPGGRPGGAVCGAACCATWSGAVCSI
uniref:Uncharacterized protein n=1 Tax=Arundo donax TaxID=35708 RepID=A0A0A8YCT0_ARUDO